MQRRLAAKSLLFDFALGRSLTRLALAHDKTDDPSDAALAAATESVGIFQRLAATLPGCPIATSPEAATQLLGRLR